MRLTSLCILFTLAIYLASSVDAFVPSKWISPHIKHTRICASSSSEDDEKPEVVTREMFQRDLLGDPSVKRKKKGKGYRVLDNRDSLPFVVKDMTPDPYKKPDAIKNEAKHNTKKHGKKPKNANGNLVPKTTQSRLFKKNKDGTLDRILGEFALDKSTTCGDLIEVGEFRYVVQKARCQYKYAGGKRFVMVRKILEVKEVTRIAQENYLTEQIRRMD